MNTAKPINIAILAMGGEGGGVLADWLVRLGESGGYLAQTTSVPGVSQRTGATIYYLELFPSRVLDFPHALKVAGRKAGRIHHPDQPSCHNGHNPCSFHDVFLPKKRDNGTISLIEGSSVGCREYARPPIRRNSDEKIGTFPPTVRRIPPLPQPQEHAAPAQPALPRGPSFFTGRWPDFPSCLCTPRS